MGFSPKARDSTIVVVNEMPPRCLNKNCRTASFPNLYVFPKIFFWKFAFGNWGLGLY